MEYTHNTYVLSNPTTNKKIIQEAKESFKTAYLDKLIDLNLENKNRLYPLFYSPNIGGRWRG